MLDRLLRLTAIRGAARLVAFGLQGFFHGFADVLIVVDYENGHSTCPSSPRFALRGQPPSSSLPFRSLLVTGRSSHAAGTDIGRRDIWRVAGDTGCYPSIAGWEIEERVAAIC